MMRQYLRLHNPLVSLGDNPAHQPTNKSVTIVIPVYSDWKSLSSCLISLKKYAKGVRTILLNDCGPQADYLEKKILRSIRGHKNFIYLRNNKNLGFIKTCNLGVLEIDESGNDILLLNSDTRVTKGFLAEMVKVAYSDARIASVSPRSNNATVFSIPFEAATNYSYPQARSYKLYRRIWRKLPLLYEAPTTMGFCMFIKREVVERYGLFDEIYGQGYCEENDFCMRVRKHGLTHAIANRAFVFHEGSRSFSEVQRNKRVIKNNTILLKRYPNYNNLVDQYVHQVVFPEQELIRNYRNSSFLTIMAKRHDLLERISLMR